MSEPKMSAIVQTLLSPGAYSHPVIHVELVETHISWVFLTGTLAYKVKKPVNFGFVDFSTLERRRHFCEEELRLNGRLAPDLYLDVQPIAATPEGYRIGGGGEPVEYCVVMRQFDQECLLSRVVDREGLPPGQIDDLAECVAEFHAQIHRADADSLFGAPNMVAEPIRDSLDTLATLGESSHQKIFGRLRGWVDRELAQLGDQIAARKRDGFIRECHGDMHLNNMLLWNGRITIFDGIEFNDALRWIDVMSEIAFTVMDLEHRSHAGLARRFLNAYLERSGDYGGLSVFRFYVVYRALVRAKVAALRRSQETQADVGADAHVREVHEYLELADRATHAGEPFLAITHGVSGSGKSWGTQAIVDEVGVIRVRSDVERKRLAGVGVLTHSDDSQLYSPEMTHATYERLTALVTSIAQARFPVVVDAAFLKLADRTRFQRLAGQLGIPFRILDFRADEAVCRERIRQRKSEGRDVSDATEHVLDWQLRSREPLTEDEFSIVVAVDTSQPNSLEHGIAQCKALTQGR